MTKRLSKTLAMIKPDATVHTREIMSVILDSGLRILAVKPVLLDYKIFADFYVEHKGKDFFDRLCSFMSSGPVVVMVLQGYDTVQKWRDMVGSTDPSKAEEGTIRNKFGRGMPNNAVHGFTSDEEAEVEIDFFFSRLEWAQSL